jgi:FAD/FMN-containing dehydrogenase
MSAEATTRTGKPITSEVLEQLTAKVRGQVIDPAHSDYDAARRVYNAMIVKTPAIIIRCYDVADVIAGVNLAREHDLPIAIRGGGHNAAGLGTADDAVVLDLAGMHAVQVDPWNRRVRVEGGATWGDVNHATQPFGLAVPAGVVSTTGVGGLTLGGGFGYVSRGFGLTIDNLLSAEMVLADGSFVTASETEHPDLFWAIRGGGGNFGVVTAFEFVAQSVDMVTAGVLFYPVDKAGDLIRRYREFIKDAPRELGIFFGYTMTPPAPFIPEEHHLKNMAKMVFCYNGPEADARQVVEPFLAMDPAIELVWYMPFEAFNSAFDVLFPPGRLDYWKADYVTEISDEMVAVHERYATAMPNPSSIMHIYSVNGAIQDVEPGATAYSHRDANFVHVILVTDEDADRMQQHIETVRNYYDALRPLSAGGAYVNFMMDEGDDRVRATYRDNYPKLQEIKARYDPDNRFRINQNIEPRA